MIGFENMLVLASLVAVIPFIYMAYTTKNRFKKVLSMTKILTIFFLVIAAASPFVEHQAPISDQPEITVLEDSSRSTEILEEADISLENVRSRSKTIASGNQSDLKRGIIRNIEKNQAYLLISDLQSSKSLEPILKTARNKNATINILRPDSEEEKSVTVRGPDSTVPGADNVFRVKTYSTENPVEPRVYLDGEEVALDQESNNTYLLEKEFNEKGRHKLEAFIDVNDRFDSNNRFYKTVKVSEKPDILVIGDEGSLKDKLSDFYDLKYRDAVPEDLSSYYAVISKKKFSGGRLADYLAEGNGLIYTGEVEGENSVLPVKSVPSDQDNKGAKIMLAIDISKSTESEEEINKQKKVAYSLAEKLPFNNKLGAVAYNREAYLLSGPSPLATNRANLKSKISRLETGGNSFHHKGIEAASKQLDEEGNIILITDGRITAFGDRKNTRQKSLRAATSLEPRLITVGVGEEKNDRFLKDLADRGNGLYMDASQSGRLKFIFEAGGAEDRAGRIVKVNNHHFITEGLPELETRVTGYESAKPKPGSSLLISSTSGKPFLTAWRYGLGRVTAFTAGSSDLSAALSTDPLLITRTVSWAVGQPERKMDRWMKIEDGRVGEEVGIRSSYQSEELNRQSEDLYTADLKPNTTGFHEFQGKPFGYSYSPEIEEIGYNEEKEFIATRTGGTVFRPGEEQEIKERLENHSNREIKKKKSLSDYFLIAALLVFLSEVGYRKRKGKK